MSKPIRTWSEADRPREKMLQSGASSLTDSELIAIILRTGGATCSAVDLARTILDSSDNRLSDLAGKNITQLSLIPGIGTAKAASVAAAFELGRRLLSEPEKKNEQITSAECVFRIMGPYMARLDHEECWIIYLNLNNRIIKKELVSHGGVQSTIMDIKLIAKRAVDNLASKLIMVHNHPSGTLQPSAADISQTAALRDAIKLFDISLVDHIIIAGKRYYSFFDNNC